MSFHLHLRAVAESEIQDNHTWLTAFMSEAWDNHPGEYAAGIATSIEKIFSLVNDLYSAADAIEAGADKVWELPIYGGRPVRISNDADPSDPPLMLLDPPEVRRAAGFLANVSFDELWKAAATELHGRGWPEAEARQVFLSHHSDLQAFYGRAASAGHAVVKAAWY